MITLRKSKERGEANFGWLHSRHTFSFGQYFDPKHMGFGSLRVINHDKVEPGAGFGLHPHQDMEILSYVLQGTIEHKDSMGHSQQLKAGDFQWMSAGTGVTHSEFNPDSNNTLEFMQIWIEPQEKGLEPAYGTLHLQGKIEGLKKVVDPTGADGALRINQDAIVYVGNFRNGERISLDVAAGRKIWLHVIEGEVVFEDHTLGEHDAIGVEDINHLEGKVQKDSHLLVFDLA